MDLAPSAKPQILAQNFVVRADEPSFGYGSISLPIAFLQLPELFNLFEAVV